MQQLEVPRAKIAGAIEPGRLEQRDKRTLARLAAKGKGRETGVVVAGIRGFLLCIPTFLWRRHCGMSSDGRWFRW